MDSENQQQARSTVPGPLGRNSSSVRAESVAWAPGSGAPPAGAPAQQTKRTVCDHCRRRRIRCDGQFPCQQCIQVSLSCKRDHVPRKRGPKRGHGRVINELRAQECRPSRRGSRESSSDLLDVDRKGDSTDGGDTSAPQTAPNSGPSSPPDMSWNASASGAAEARGGAEARGVYTSDQYRPLSRNYFYLIPQCVEIYYEHIYPIMPLLYMPAIRTMIGRPMTESEKNLIYSLCALTCLHMRGKSIPGGPDSWEAAGRFFLDECISVRQSYDFLEDESLYAVISSFWVSTSFFEIHQDRKSWFYLKEALHLALELGLDDDATYVGLSPEEKLCRQRVFWILFVTERSFAILRYKHISFKRTPSLPTTRHWYEATDIHSGFRQLISSYEPLDESFVAAWNEKSNPAVRNDGTNPNIDDAAYRALQSTFLALQHLQDRLARPLAFLTRSTVTSISSSSEGTAHTYHDVSTPTPANAVPAYQYASIIPKVEPGLEHTDYRFPSTPVVDDPDPDPTPIQKADLLITQQWLRLIVWRKSEQRKLLSWNAQHDSMNVAFPFDIARQTVAILQSLPSSAVEVHGMGIFEKIFKIGMSYVDTLAAHDIAGRGNVGGGILNPRGFTIDPLEFLVKTLSTTPNSRTQFAEELTAYASRRPGGMKLALSHQPNMYPVPWQPPTAQQYEMSGALGPPSGAVIGEVTDEEEIAQQQQQQQQQQSGQIEVDTNTGMAVEAVHGVSYTSGYDGLMSPGGTNAFGDPVAPGLDAGVMWTPPLINAHHQQHWAAVNPGGSGEASTAASFSFNTNIAPAGFPYATYNGESLAGAATGPYQSYGGPTAQGGGTGDMHDEESRKRNWDTSMGHGNWQA